MKLFWLLILTIPLIEGIDLDESFSKLLYFEQNYPDYVIIDYCYSSEIVLFKLKKDAVVKAVFATRDAFKDDVDPNSVYVHEHTADIEDTDLQTGCAIEGKNLCFYCKRFFSLKNGRFLCWLF